MALTRFLTIEAIEGEQSSTRSTIGGSPREEFLLHLVIVVSKLLVAREHQSKSVELVKKLNQLK